MVINGRRKSLEKGFCQLIRSTHTHTPALANTALSALGAVLCAG